MHKPSARGFSQVELLVSVGTISVLMAMLFPAIQSTREAARRTRCLNNLSQIVLASHSYESCHMRFPSGATEIGTGMFVTLAPYLQMRVREFQHQKDPAYLWIYLDELSKNRFDALLCSAAVSELADEGYEEPFVGDVPLGKNVSHYVGIAGPVDSPQFLVLASPETGLDYSYDMVSPTPLGGPVGTEGLFSPDSDGNYFRARSRRFRDIRDGSSNTMAFAEFSQSDVLGLKAGWSFGAVVFAGQTLRIFSAKSIAYGINEPVPQERGVSLTDLLNETTNITPLGSEHPGGCNVAMADGSAKFVTDDISLPILKTMASIAGGEAIDTTSHVEIKPR